MMPIGEDHQGFSVVLPGQLAGGVQLDQLWPIDKNRLCFRQCLIFWKLLVTRLGDQFTKPTIFRGLVQGRL